MGHVGSCQAGASAAEKSVNGIHAIRLGRPYVKRPASLAGNQEPLRNEVATKVLARKFALVRAADLSWTHDAEVIALRTPLWPGAKVAKEAGSRKGFSRCSRWCRCKRCGAENTPCELLRGVCPKARAGLGLAPKPSSVRKAAAKDFHKRACREQSLSSGSQASARKVSRVLKRPAAKRVLPKL